jgi:hypothetical protein
MLWKELLKRMDKLLNLQLPTHRTTNTLRGECLGLATAIAIMTNPYKPDVDAVRAEAMRRQKEAQ